MRMKFLRKPLEIQRFIYRDECEKYESANIINPLAVRLYDVEQTAGSFRYFYGTESRRALFSSGDLRRRHAKLIKNKYRSRRIKPLIKTVNAFKMAKRFSQTPIKTTRREHAALRACRIERLIYYFDKWFN